MSDTRHCDRCDQDVNVIAFASHTCVPTDSEDEDYPLDSEGWLKCHHCDGSGRDIEGWNCEFCDGTGELEI